eukprot:gene5177-10354_t
MIQDSTYEIIETSSQRSLKMSLESSMSTSASTQEMKSSKNNKEYIIKPKVKRDILRAKLHVQVNVEVEVDLRRKRSTMHTTSVSQPPLPSVTATKLPAVNLPSTMRFLNDVTLPEAPLICLLLDSFNTLCQSITSSTSSNSTSTLDDTSQNKSLLKSYLYNKVLYKIDMLHMSSLRYFFSNCTSNSCKAYITKQMKILSKHKHNPKFRTGFSYIEGSGNGNGNGSSNSNSYNTNITDTKSGNATTVLNIVPIFTILQVLCEEWLSIPTEIKSKFNDSYENSTTLKRLHEIYSGDGEVLQDINEEFSHANTECAQYDAQILKLDKLKRRLERHWEDETATADDLMTLQDTRVKLTEVKAQRISVLNRIKLLKKRKRTFNKELEGLWDTALATADTDTNIDTDTVTPVTNSTTRNKNNNTIKTTSKSNTNTNAATNTSTSTSKSTENWRDKVTEFFLIALQVNLERENEKIAAEKIFENSLHPDTKKRKVQEDKVDVDVDVEDEYDYIDDPNFQNSLDMIEDELRKIEGYENNDNDIDIDNDLPDNESIADDNDFNLLVIKDDNDDQHEDGGLGVSVSVGHAWDDLQDGEFNVEDESDRIYAELEAAVARALRGEVVEEVEEEVNEKKEVIAEEVVDDTLVEEHMEAEVEQVEETEEAVIDDMFKLEPEVVVVEEEGIIEVDVDVDVEDEIQPEYEQELEVQLVEDDVSAAPEEDLQVQHLEDNYEVEVEPGVHTITEEDPEDIQFREMPSWLTSAVLAKVEQQREKSLQKRALQMKAYSFYKFCQYSPMKNRKKRNNFEKERNILNFGTSVLRNKGRRALRFWNFWSQCRGKRKEFKRGLLRLQAITRGMIQRLHYQWILYQHHAAIKIQRTFRGYYIRCNLFKSRVLEIHEAAESNDYDTLLRFATYYPSLLFELDIYGNTALHNAVKAASRRTVKLLLRMNFDPNVLNVSGYTPLHLLISSESRTRDILLEYLIERGFDEDIRTPDGKTCLQLACEYGRDALVEAFLRSHMDPAATDSNGSTCLQVACTHGFHSIAQKLLAYGADPNQSGYGGASALHAVTHCGDVDIARTLISYGAYINNVDSYSLTPLMWACQQGFVDLIKYFIIDCDANIHAQDSQGRMAVHYAALSNLPKVLHTLREAEVNFDEFDLKGDTPLHLTAEQGYYEMAKTLLQEGAQSSIQNYEGNQPLHIAARYNQVSVMRILVAYDKHIGRVNYHHQTPLGVSKFYGSKEAQEFLEEQFYREDSADERDKDGNIWWDKMLDVTTQEWKVEVSSLGTREYINKMTGERRDTPPTLSSNVVWDAATNVELHMKRVVQRTDENKIHTRNGYLLDVEELTKDVEELRHQNDAATIISKNIRRKLCYIHYTKYKELSMKKKRITRFLKRYQPLFHHWKMLQRSQNATKIQALYRGYTCRLYLKWNGGFYYHWYIKYGTALARIVTFNWHAYKHNKLARLTVFLMRSPKSRQAWKKVLDEAGHPIRCVCMHEEYLYPNTYDIIFYRNITTGRIFLGKPKEIEEKDRSDRIEYEQIMKYGYTLAQNGLAKKLQAIWRGYRVRSYDLLVRRAVRISVQAEELYFSNPNLDKNILNYALYTHVVLRDYNKATVVYAEALRRMQFRGPDIAFILYAYAIFAFVSHEQDILDCYHMIQRAKSAEENRALLKHGANITEIQKSIANKTFRYGAVFHLADVGFFKHAAQISYCREAWHNYAVCRFLVYDDYYGSLDAFLSAFRYDPGDKLLNDNFYIMMSHFHGNDKAQINALVNERMRAATLKQYEVKRAKQTKLDKILLEAVAIVHIQIL